MSIPMQSCVFGLCWVLASVYLPSSLCDALNPVNNVSSAFGSSNSLQLPSFPQPPPFLALEFGPYSNSYDSRPLAVIFEFLPDFAQ